MPLISFQNVTLGYDGCPVIKNLSFQVNKGDYLCVLGANGSGKSTMMKALLGWVAPMSGKIRKDKMLKNTIGYLPQQSVSQADFPASVREVVLSGCQARHRFLMFYSGKDRERAAYNMKRLNISHLEGRSFRELSGGQKQRVLLARAVCAAEDLILLDEPVTGLDPVVTEELYGMIRQLNKEGMTVIMISHDPEHALADATHILHLGREMLYFGSASDYDREKILEIEEASSR